MKRPKNLPPDCVWIPLRTVRGNIRRRKAFRRWYLFPALGARCFYCGKLTIAGRKAGLLMATRDHVIPVAQTKDKARGPFVRACLGCNMRKGARTLEEYKVALKITQFPGEAQNFPILKRASYERDAYRAQG